MNDTLNQKYTVGEFCQALEDAAKDASSRGGDTITSLAETLRWYAAHPSMKESAPLHEQMANAIMDGLMGGRA